VFEWSNKSSHGQLFQWASTIKIYLIKLVGLKQSGHCWNIICSHHDIAAKCSLDVKQQSLAHTSNGLNIQDDCHGQ
jgi:hypothetical protein